MAGSSVGRSLLQTPPSPPVKPPVVVNSSTGHPCIMMWADTLLTSYSTNEVDLGIYIFNGSATTTGSVCNETVSRSEAFSSRNRYTFQHYSYIIYWKYKIFDYICFSDLSWISKTFWVFNRFSLCEYLTHNPSLTCIICGFDEQDSLPLLDMMCILSWREKNNNNNNFTYIFNTSLKLLYAQDLLSCVCSRLDRHGAGCAGVWRAEGGL